MMEAVTQALQTVEKLQSGEESRHPFMVAAKTWALWAVVNCRGRRLRLALSVASALIAYADYDGDLDPDLL